MTRTDSRYFATAARMDEAFLALLEKKDLPYITVKELCAAAHVNRSTFYLHYETIADLLSESMEHMNEQFLAYMQKDAKTFVTRLRDCPLEELDLVTPEYLVPYLGYIREHQRLFRTATEHAETLDLAGVYEQMFRHVFDPILARLNVPRADRAYVMAFFMHGLMAVVTEWLRGGCADSVEHVVAVIQTCVMRRPGASSAGRPGGGAA